MSDYPELEFLKFPESYDRKDIARQIGHFRATEPKLKEQFGMSLRDLAMSFNEIHRYTATYSTMTALQYAGVAEAAEVMRYYRGKKSSVTLRADTGGEV